MTQPNLEVVGVRAVVQGFDAYVRQTAQVQRSTTNMARGVTTAGKQASTAGASFRKFATSAGAMATGLLGVQVGLASVRSAFGGTIGAAIAFESSFAGVRKTVDATEEQFAVLEAGFRSLSKELPLTVFELNRIGEAAGQLGIETASIIDFTETMAKLGATTNLSANEAATALARLANITQLPQDQFDELGSTIVDLGNNFATTEAEIVNFALRIAGAGNQIGLTQAEILAFGTALSSVGIKAEAGGTAISRVFIEIDKAVRQGGDALASFAEVAGVTADEFAQSYGTDAAGAITTFIEGLGRISDSGGDVFSVLEGLGLQSIRVRDALLRASGAGDLLRDALELGSAAWEENTALQAEFAQRAETSAAQFQILKNRITDMGITVGTTLVPALLQGTTAFVGWLEALKALEPILPTIITALGALAAILVAQKLFQMAQGIGAVTTAARSAVVSNGPLLALVAAVVALDVGLRILTGEGLFSKLAGGMNEAEKAAKGLADETERLEQLQRGAFSDTERLERLQRDLAAATRDYAEAQRDAVTATESLGPALAFFEGSIQGAEQAVSDLSATWIANITAQEEAGLSAEGIIAAYNDLDSTLKALVADSDSVVGAFAEIRSQQEDGIDTSREFRSEINLIEPAFDRGAEAANRFARQLFGSLEVVSTFGERLRDLANIGKTEVQVAFDELGRSTGPLDFIDKMIGVFEAAAPDIEKALADSVGDGGTAGVRSGGARVVKEAEKVAQDAIGAFTGVIAGVANRRRLEEEFGKVGGAVADAFLRAIIEPTEKAGETLGRAIQALFDEVESTGVPLSEEAGRALMDALALGIDMGTPGATQAALDAIRGITDALDDGARSAVEIFRETLGEIARDERLDALFGQKGSDLFDALTEGMESGSERAIASAARQGLAIRDILEDNLGRRQGKALGDALMDALEQSLADGGSEALSVLRAILAEINEELAGVTGFTGGEQDGRAAPTGAIDPGAFSESLKDFARDLGLDPVPANLRELAAILAAGRTPVFDPGTGRLSSIPPGAPAPAPAPDPGLVLTGGTFATEPIPFPPPRQRGGFIAPETIASPSTRSLSPGDKRDTTVNVDLSGASFTGSPEENGDAIAGAVRDILGDEQTVGAFQAGVS